MTRSTVDTLSLRLVTRYLRAHGWHKEGTSESHSLYIHNVDGGNPLEIFVANSEEVRGWQSSVREAIETLSGFSGKSIDEMVRAVRTIIYDVVYSRLPDEAVHDDSIELEVAAEFIWRSKRVLAASATAEILKKRYFKRVRKEAQSYAGGCRFGHTFRGSFGFTLESPLPEPQKNVFGGVDAPFERRVIERLIRGLASIDSAVAQRDPEILASGYLDGWNGNICDEFLKLYAATKQSKVSFNVAWSPEIPLNINDDTARSFVVSPQKIEFIQEAAMRLRAREEEMVETVVGKVVILKSEDDVNALIGGDGEIAVRWNHDELGKIKVYMRLSNEEYKIAIQAHEQGRNISARGTLEKPGKFWRIDELEHFRMLD